MNESFFSVPYPRGLLQLDKASNHVWTIEAAMREKSLISKENPDLLKLERVLLDMAVNSGITQGVFFAIHQQ